MALGIPIALPFRVHRAAFDPGTLFRNGEQGGWYDPSDMSTLFQDAAGTTPVTALGQPVGLMLDKSRLVIGPEQVITPYTGSSGGPWLVGSSSITRNGGSSTGFAEVNMNLASVSGQTYLVQFTVADLSGDTFVCRVGGGPFFHVTANGNYAVRIAGGGTGPTILFVPFAGAAGEATITSISVRALPGNHLTQTTAASRPLWQQDAAGALHLAFDGVDDFLTIGTFNMSASDKVTVCAGVRKLSDAARGIVAELSATSATNAGSFALTAPESTVASGNFGFVSGGSLAGSAVAQSATILSPVSRVVTATADIVGDTALVRLNGIQSGATATADQGTGNYGAAYPLFVGRRGGTTLPFNGNLHGLVIRGTEATTTQIAALERYMARQTGIAL